MSTSSSDVKRKRQAAPVAADSVKKAKSGEPSTITQLDDTTDLAKKMLQGADVDLVNASAALAHLPQNKITQTLSAARKLYRAARRDFKEAKQAGHDLKVELDKSKRINATLKAVGGHERVFHDVLSGRLDKATKQKDAAIAALDAATRDNLKMQELLAQTVTGLADTESAIANLAIKLDKAESTAVTLAIAVCNACDTADPDHGGCDCHPEDDAARDDCDCHAQFERGITLEAEKYSACNTLAESVLDKYAPAASTTDPEPTKAADEAEL